MTEERKHAILFAATLLSARKIIEVIESDDPMNMGRAFWVDKFVNKAIEQAAQILEKIDAKWPAEEAGSIALRPKADIRKAEKPKW